MLKDRSLRADIWDGVMKCSGETCHDAIHVANLADEALRRPRFPIMRLIADGDVDADPPCLFQYPHNGEVARHEMVVADRRGVLRFAAVVPEPIEAFVAAFGWKCEAAKTGADQREQSRL